MSRDEILSNLIRDAVRPISHTLYDSLAEAHTAAKDALPDSTIRKYPFKFPIEVRTQFRDKLDAIALPFPWVVAGNTAQMAQTFLEHPDQGIRLRFLKESRNGNGVPPAGKNSSRRNSWKQPALFSTADLAEIQPMPDRKACDIIEYLLLWDQPQRDELSMRLVHTTEAGIYGRPVSCDVDFLIKDEGTLFDTLAFKGNDSPTQFFIDEAQREI